MNRNIFKKLKKDETSLRDFKIHFVGRELDFSELIELRIIVLKSALRISKNMNEGKQVLVCTLRIARLERLLHRTRKDG